MPIELLSTQLANQIAAGEVIEGPVSVVKECVENAIDAQASQITITLEKGGHALIQIMDNGIGMDQDDLSKCILPHATSKIKNYDDLHAIGTLGFRGEALASIASVAELSITSKTAAMKHAFRGHAKPTPSGKDVQWDLSPASHLVGTTVCVEDLFYLTPARKKFMKSERADLNKIIDWVQKLALAQWDVGFTVIHEGKNKLVLPVADSWERIEQRISTILGANFLKHSMYIDQTASGIRLHGWVSMPQYDRGQPDQQYTFVNHRYVKDKILIKAAKQAYQKLLFHGRHGAYVLYLEMDPKLVDVNVHPSKAEVRFADSRAMFQFIQATLTTALKEVPVYVTDRRETVESPAPATSTIATNTKDLSFTAPTSSPMQADADVAVIERPKVAVSSYQVPLTAQAQPQLKQAIPDYKLNPKQVASAETMTVHAPQAKQDLGHAIAQCHHRYILAQNAEGLIVVDQHAAHERILFEKLKSQNQDAKQKLLIKESITLENFDAALAAQFIQQLNLFGFDLALAEAGLTIQAVPLLLKAQQVEAMLQDAWLTWVHEEGQEHKVAYIIDRILANMACKAAIKVNHPLTITQMNAILRDMEQVEYGGLCNHGRPAVRFFDLDQMDKWFLRGQ